MPTWGLQPIWTRFAIAHESCSSSLNASISLPKYTYPSLLLTASVILLITFGPVTIFKLNSYSSPIIIQRTLLSLLLLRSPIPLVWQVVSLSCIFSVRWTIGYFLHSPVVTLAKSRRVTDWDTLDMRKVRLFVPPRSLQYPTVGLTEMG